MVRATTSTSTQKYDLTSVEGGWVELRKMSYGDYLTRRDMAMKMGVSGFRKGTGDEKIDIDMIQTEVTRFEFKVCIADHNLEDENGRKLTLSEAVDFNKLDSRIGEEISSLIDSLVKFDETKSEGVSVDGFAPTDVPGASGADA